jgi:hypothetical protein
MSEQLLREDTARHEIQEDEGYRPVCGLAVAGLIVGLLSVVVLFGEVFWPVAGLGVVLSLVALRRIATVTPPMVGRAPALVGLVLSLFFLAAGVTQSASYHYLLLRQTAAVADQWFDALRNNDPYRANELLRSPEVREAPGTDLRSRYHKSVGLMTELNNFKQYDPVPMLLSLGEEAQIEFLTHDMVVSNEKRDEVVDVYRLKYEVQGKPASKYVVLIMQREARHRNSLGGWRIHSIRTEYPMPR